MGMDAFSKQTYRRVWSVLSDFYGSGNIVTQGDLHLITSLGTADASTSTINFQVFPNSAVTTPEGSQQLNTSDAFFALQHSFAVAHTTTAALVNKAQWDYFPNEYIFTDADELAAMKQLYATGRYNVTIDSKVYYQNYLVSRFQQANVAQKGLVLTTAGANPYSLSETDGDTTAVRDLIPTMFFNGDSNIEIKVTTPTSAQLGGNGTTYNWAAMNYHGFSISGGKIDKARIPALMANIRAAIYR